jgi:ATP-dependent RNA helicase RhlE
MHELIAYTFLNIQGYDIPTPIQRQAVPLAMMGRDVIGIAKTGNSVTLNIAHTLTKFVMNLTNSTQCQRNI